MDFDKFVHNCFILLLTMIEVGFLAGLTWSIYEYLQGG